MFAKRIIPCLDCKDGRVVKGIRFVNLRDAGDPGDLAETYNREGADELVMLDISASRESRVTLMDTVHRVACRLFIPLTVGGGVRTLEDARRLLSVGADKVAVNTAAVEAPNLVDKIASHFGSQAVVVAIDARARNARARAANSEPEGERSSQDEPVSRWTVLTYGGTRETGLDALEWARRVEALGAGEILLTSMDADGTQRGFDCELTATISTVVHIPVIASGGAVGPQHFAEVSCGALPAPHWPLQSSTTGSTPSAASKEYLRLQDVPVRLD